MAGTRILPTTCPKHWLVRIYLAHLPVHSQLAPSAFQEELSSAQACLSEQIRLLLVLFPRRQMGRRGAGGIPDVLSPCQQGMVKRGLSVTRAVPASRSHRDQEGPAGTNSNQQEPTGTNRDHRDQQDLWGSAGTKRDQQESQDKQGPAGINRDQQGPTGTSSNHRDQQRPTGTMRTRRDEQEPTGTMGTSRNHRDQSCDSAPVWGVPGGNKGMSSCCSGEKGRKTKQDDEVTFPSRSRTAWLLASRTSVDTGDGLQTSHLLGNGLDTRPHINSYCNTAQCQGLHFPAQNINKGHSGLKCSI